MNLSFFSCVEILLAHLLKTNALPVRLPYFIEFTLIVMNNGMLAFLRSEGGRAIDRRRNWVQDALLEEPVRRSDSVFQFIFRCYHCEFNYECRELAVIMILLFHILHTHF